MLVISGFLSGKPDFVQAPLAFPAPTEAGAALGALAELGLPGFCAAPGALPPWQAADSKAVSAR